jgi:hypothetical protein
MTRLTSLLTIVLIALLSPSCGDPETVDSRNVDPEKIFFDYQVSGAEDDSMVTVLLQYHFRSPHGTTLLVDNPGKIELDGVQVLADSSRLSGYFYEARVPRDLFAGPHTIVFTGSNKQQYKEEFSFHPLSLETALPDTIARETFIIELKGLEPEDYVRLLITDTSRLNDGINRLDTVINGQLRIAREDLDSLSSGPMNLQLIREYERPATNPTGRGGWIAITYALHREFVLK